MNAALSEILHPPDKGMESRQIIIDLLNSTDASWENGGGHDWKELVKVAHAWLAATKPVY